VESEVRYISSLASVAEDLFVEVFCDVSDRKKHNIFQYSILLWTYTGKL
jgi:hypothetical protein